MNLQLYFFTCYQHRQAGFKICLDFAEMWPNQMYRLQQYFQETCCWLVTKVIQIELKDKDKVGFLHCANLSCIGAHIAKGAKYLATEKCMKHFNIVNFYGVSRSRRVPQCDNYAPPPRKNQGSRVTFLCEAIKK